jgi:hypothetical protein
MKNTIIAAMRTLGGFMLGYGVVGFYQECFLTASTPAQIAVAYAVMALGAGGAACFLWMAGCAVCRTAPDRVKGFVPFVLLAVAVSVIAAAWANKAPAAQTHTTINRAPLMEAEEQDSGDSELAHVKFINAVDRATGWSKLSMDEQAVRVKVAGLFIETVGKAMPKNPITGGFWHSFFRQMGVQMQIQAMHHLDEISHEPLIAAAQGFLVGL